VHAAVAPPPAPIDAAIELHVQGLLTEALASYRRVIASPAPPEERGAALNNACAIEAELGRLQRALGDCRAALALREPLGDPGAIAETLNNLGMALEALGRPGEAATHYQRALALNRRLGDAESVVVNLGNLGALAISGGRYGEAMRLYREAEALAARAEPEPWAEEQRRTARINQGVVLEKLGALPEALALYRELLAGPMGEDERRRAALQVNAGVVLRNLGDPVAAAAAYEEAIAVYRAHADLPGESNAWLNLALAYHIDLGRPRAAEEAYRTALELARRAGDSTEEVQDLFYLGRLLLERSRLDEAEELFGRCLAVAESSGAAEGRWSALEGLGRVAARRGELERASRLLLEAIAEIERVRGGLGRAEWRAGYFGDKRATYSATVDVLARLAGSHPAAGYAARALEVVQRAKVRDLLDAIGGDAVASPASATELRTHAGEGRVLEYFVAEGRLLLWSVQRGGITLSDRGPAEPILAAAARAHRALAGSSEPTDADLAALSSALLPAGLAPSRRGTRLRVAPDGVLHYLPFELLRPAGGDALLADRTTISYLPSASTLGAHRGGAVSPGAMALAGFAAPATPPLGQAAAAAPDAPLAAAEGELRTIAALLPGPAALYVGSRATEAAVREAGRRGARVVHFATHASVSEGPGGGAAVHLAPAGDDDGLLTPREVAALELRCGLTVLAACRTALPSAGDGGRGLASLTGSFLAAGSPAVVATLWDVEDSSTAVVMEQLYAQLARGRAPAEALQRAKARLRRDPRWDRPALWAAYVIVGEGAPVANPPRGRLAAAAALAAVGLLLLAAGGRLTRRRASRSPA
jgi:tetratricopeptide (TPR) repeat protein